METPNGGVVSFDWAAQTIYGRVRSGSRSGSPVTTHVDEDNNKTTPGGDNHMFSETEYTKSLQHLQGLDLEKGDAWEDATAHYTDTSMLKVPLLGRIHFVFHVQGFMQIGFIFFYWIYGSSTSMFVVLLPMYNDGIISPLLILFYCYVSVCCIVSLIRANTMSPGRVTQRYTLQFAAVDRGYCTKCQMERPPQSHHCRRCGHCVIKMDHHCPWINNCVGDENQYMFILLLFYAVTLSVSTLSLNLMYFYHFPPCQTCDKDSVFIAHQKGLMSAAVVMALLMIGFAGLLLSMQLVNLMFDMTSLDWMKLQAELKKKFDVKKLPKKKLTMVQGLEVAFGRGNKLLWLLPFRKRGPPPMIQHAHDEVV